jgi:hypothetical protein
MPGTVRQVNHCETCCSTQACRGTEEVKVNNIVSLLIGAIVIVVLVILLLRLL